MHGDRVSNYPIATSFCWGYEAVDVVTRLFGDIHAFDNVFIVLLGINMKYALEYHLYDEPPEPRSPFADHQITFRNLEFLYSLSNEILNALTKILPKYNVDIEYDEESNSVVIMGDEETVQKIDEEVDSITKYSEKINRCYEQYCVNHCWSNGFVLIGERTVACLYPVNG